MKFPESQFAHQYLDGLKGIEIGGAAHNSFGLDTINVDKFALGSPGHAVYAAEQFRLCGEVMPVDVVAPGDELPFPDKSFDFVLASHVIEHFFDPIKSLKEWARVARKYIFIVCPFRDAHPPDRDKPLTTWQELLNRHNGLVEMDETDDHHSRWTEETFVQMLDCLSLDVADIRSPDDKVGNGFMVVIPIEE